MYVSQEEVFSDFNDTEALFWFHRDLVYGDWNTGESGDGCYQHSIEMDIPEVGMTEDGGEGQWGRGQTDGRCMVMVGGVCCYTVKQVDNKRV